MLLLFKIFLCYTISICNIGRSVSLKKIFYIFFLLMILTMQGIFTQDKPELVVKKSQCLYSKFLSETYSQFEQVQSSTQVPFGSFVLGKNIEAYYTQARGVVNKNKNYTFHPHFVQTVIIAIDRDQTNVHFEGFKDVLESDLPVSFSFGFESAPFLWDSPESQHIVTTMAKSLYGTYDIKKVAKDFERLHKSNRFYTNDDSLPVLIMYDNDAVNMNTQGRNLEIIIPKEGSQSFIVGVLTNENLHNLSDSDTALLVQYDFRTFGGQSKDIYPDRSEYNKVTFINNTHEYNIAASDVGPVLRRHAFEYEKFGFLSNKERAAFYVYFLIFMSFYIISISRRITNKNIRQDIILVCIFQVMLASMGCFKALIFDNALIETIFWYGYYLAFIAIPAIYLHVAIISGKNREDSGFSIAYSIYVCISILLVLFVWTNNIHGFVFTVYDYTNSTFDYNTGYYIIMAWIYATICLALGILMYKVSKMPRKNALILPFVMNIITIIWLVGYAMRIPIFYDLDFAYSINIIILLYLESCIQSKLFPANSKYKKMFANSDLCMEIHDYNDIVVDRALKTVEENRDYMLRKSLIDGGYFLYFEDYTELNKTTKELKETNEQLKKNIEFLKKETKIKAELAAISAEKAVYEKIDDILNKDTKRIDELLDAIESTDDTHHLAGRINIIVCAIKRKCILRINTLYKETQKIDEFLNYIGEMQEYTSLLPLKITVGCRYFENLTIMQAVGIYDLFCIVVEKSAKNNSSEIVVQLYEDNDSIIFSIIPDVDIKHENIDAEIKNTLEYSGGSISIKNMDDTSAILLLFKKGKSIC